LILRKNLPSLLDFTSISGSGILPGSFFYSNIVRYLKPGFSSKLIYPAHFLHLRRVARVLFFIFGQILLYLKVLTKKSRSNMKRLLIVCGLAAGLLAISCKKDQNGNSSESFYPCNDADLLINKVLVLDQNGKITGTRGPLQLNEADPGMLTIAAEDYDAAKEWFEDIVPDYADLVINGDNMIWNLRDTLNAKQGQVVLKPVSGKADGRIAELEVPVSVRPLSGVVFIPRDALGQNDDELEEKESCDALDPYYLGATIDVRSGKLPEGSVMLDGFIRGSGAFVVIQEYTVAVQDGFLLHLEPGEQNIMSPSVDDSKHFNRCSSVWTLDVVHDILKANPSIHSNLSALQMPSWDNWYMCYRNSADQTKYRYNLKNTDKGLEKLWFFGEWKYYEAWVYQFRVRCGGGPCKVYIDTADNGRW